MDQTNSIISTFRKNADSVQNTVSTELTSENNIAKILCTKATSFINNYEAILGELKFNGTVCFSTTFVSTDGEYFTLSSTENFSGKLEDTLITPTTNAMFNSNVIELKVDSSSNDIKLTSTVETEISLILNDNINTYVKDSNDIVTNSNFVNFSALNSNGKLSFNFQENFEIKENLNKVLKTSANAKILNYSLGTDYFTVEGIVFVNTLYEIDNNENKNINQFTNCYKFKEELEVEGITKEGYMVINTYINNCDIVNNVNKTDDNTTISFDIPINVNYAYFKTQTSEVIVDAYSLTNKVNLNIESFKVDGKNLGYCFEEKIDGQTVINEDAPRIMKYVAFCGENVSITNM